ncbi:rsph1 [Symbiodinium sp. KB8]|nr:rsph1 [Symbiodinium sp. KB8]
MVLAAIFGAIPATPAKTRAAHAGYIFEVLRPALGAISDLSLSSQLMNHDQLSILATCGRSHTDQARECLREFANRLDEQEAQQILRLRHYGFALRQAARDFQLLGVEAPDLGRTCTDLEVRSQSQAASGPAGAADGDRDEGPEVENPDAGARAESAAPQIDSADEAKLRAIFKTCDTNGDGTINKRELIKMCRQSFETAMFFGLPSVIKQEDGSRAKLEERFQRMDQNDDREVTWEEFHHWYMSEMAAAPKPSAAPTARSSADSAEMAPRASLSLTEELDSETELSPRPEPRAGAKPAIASGVVKALTDMVEASEVSETGLQVEDQPASQERVENAMRFLDFVYEQVAANTHDGQVTRRDLEDLILASDSYGQCFECLGTVPGNDLTTSDIDIGTVEFTDHFLDEVACEHLEGLRLLTVPPEPWNPVPARRLEVAASMALEPPEASAKDTPVLAITDPTPEPADYALALAFSTGLKPTQQEAVDDQLEEPCEQTQVSTALAVLDEPVSSTLPAQEEVVSEMAPAQPVLPITEVQVPVQAVPDNWFADAVSPVAERPALPPVPMRELEDASGGLPTIPSGRGVGLPDSSDLTLPDPTPKLDLGSSLLSTAADTWAPTLEESQSLSMAKTTESASGQRPVQAFASAQSATFFGQVPTETFQMQTVEVQAQPAQSAQVGLAKSSVLQLTEAPNSQRSLRFEEAQEAQQSPSSQNARRQGSDDERPSTWRTDPTRSSDASCPQSQEPSNTRAPTGAGAVPPLPLGCLNGESARPSQEPFRMDMGQAAYSANQASGQFASFEEHMRTSAGPFPRWGPESYRMGQIQRDDFAYESSLPGFPFPYDDSLPDALQEQIQAFYHELQETKARQRRAERDNDELVGYLAALLGEPDHANTRSDARTPLGSSRAEDVVRQTLPMPPAPAELQTVEQPPPPPPPPSQPFQDLLSKPMVNISFGAGPSQAVESRPQRTSEHVLTESVASILPLAFRNLLERPQLDRGEQLQQQMLQQMQQQQQQMQQLQQQQLQLQMHLSQAQAKTSTPRPASQPSQRSILDQLRAELAAEKRQAAPAPISPEVTALQDMLKELRDAGQATIGQLLDALQDVRTTQQRLERQALIPALPAPAYIGEDSMQSHGLHSSMSQPVIPKSYQSYQDTSAVSQPRIKAFETDIPRSPVKGLFVPRSSEDGRRAWAPAPARPLIPRRRPQGQPSQCSAPRGPQRALFDQEMARWDARAQQLEAQFRRLHGPAAQPTGAEGVPKFPRIYPQRGSPFRPVQLLMTSYTIMPSDCDMYRVIFHPQMVSVCEKVNFAVSATFCDSPAVAIYANLAKPAGIGDRFNVRVFVEPTDASAQFRVLYLFTAASGSAGQGVGTMAAFLVYGAPPGQLYSEDISACAVSAFAGLEAFAARGATKADKAVDLSRLAGLRHIFLVSGAWFAFQSDRLLQTATAENVQPKFAQLQKTAEETKDELRVAEQIIDGVQGQETYEDGSSYEGQLADGRRHGHGTWTSVAEQYCGQWVHDQRHGKARHFMSFCCQEDIKDPS